ncbi:unnamed protein product [Linum trigynum]|uniref:RNase H type-1 domain-containing protein n=1 Tax=Linum trigynum TaxID=586398 RepID=A0AAV2EVY5_9ROSI
MISEISPFHILQCICQLWRIWKSRNAVTFEFYQPHVRSLARKFYNKVLEVSNLLPPPPPPRSVHPISPPPTWSPPPANFLKINFDVAVRDSGCSSGLVVRGSDGHVVVAVGLCHQGVVDPYLAELLAVRDAISFVASRSLSQVIVEGDSEVVVNQIRQGVLEISVGGPVLRECRQILDSLSAYIEFRAVLRAANSAAHRVARKALLLSFLELESFDFVGWLH